jgi:membrane-bound inhibitor of C-type lysozyme
MIRATLAFALTAAPALAQDAPLGLAVDYACADGATLQVAYLNPPGGPSLAVVAWEGRLVPMAAGPTGSGVRYVATDPALGLVWHSKGDAGTLLHDAGSTETVLLGDCASAP